MTTSAEAPPRQQEVLEAAVIRFAGDSGDGMQITGSQFTNTAALFGNDISTFPDYPAEIRAPAGTLPGVSGFQVHFGAGDINTPGDAIDALVAMNPAALKVNLPDLKTSAILIVNIDNFKDIDLRKAQVKANPLEDHTLDGYRLFPVELTKLTRAALRDVGLDTRSQDRCKNFFALGMCYWLFSRTLEATERWLDEKFGSKPVLAEANKLALKAGYAYCGATEAFQVRYEVPPAHLPPGVYRNLSGNVALAMGFVAASRKSGRPLFLGSYPITPASDILHALAPLKEFGVVTFQAEDEIAAITAAIGASYTNALIECGANCCLSTNNVLNPFTPFGDCSLIRIANLYANVAQRGRDDELRACFDMLTPRPARLIGCADYGIAIGHPADLIVLDATSAAEAVATIAPALFGFKRGLRTFTRPLPTLHRPERGRL